MTLKHHLQVHVFYPIIGRAINRALRWLCSQEGWEDIVSTAAHVVLESSSPVVVRAAVAQVMAMVGSYLNQDSSELPRLVDEIARTKIWDRETEKDDDISALD